MAKHSTLKALFLAPLPICSTQKAPHRSSSPLPPNHFPFTPIITQLSRFPVVPLMNTPIVSCPASLTSDSGAIPEFSVPERMLGFRQEERCYLVSRINSNDLVTRFVLA
ncbi:hypothetical protein B0J14DRAFT_583654 [Halenospora varia]|nr:hypothetical protein B0J14DRAFT_583654 [Halenospora varia]